jgi:predicted ATPase
LKISIHCLSPIDSYEFDLDKDFHLIVGRNSVGKSYAITVVYLILKAFLAWDTRTLYPFIQLNTFAKDTSLGTAVKQLTAVSESKTLPLRFYSVQLYYSSRNFAMPPKSIDCLIVVKVRIRVIRGKQSYACL